MLLLREEPCLGDLRGGFPAAEGALCGCLPRTDADFCGGFAEEERGLPAAAGAGNFCGGFPALEARREREGEWEEEEEEAAGVDSERE